MHSTTSHTYQNHLRICAWTTIPLITEDFLGFKSSLPTWRPIEDYIWWLHSGWVIFGSFSRVSKTSIPIQTLNQPTMPTKNCRSQPRTFFFSQWWDPQSSDSGPHYVILSPFYHCDGPSPPPSLFPLWLQQHRCQENVHHQPTTQHAAPGSSIKIRHNCSGTGIPAIGIAPTGFTENSGLVLIIFMQE